MGIRREIDSNTIIVGDFNTPLTSMDRLPSQKINMETVSLNDTLNQMDLTDIYRIFHPKTAEYMFFSSAYGTFSRTDRILDHKQASTNLKRSKSYHAAFLTTTL